MCVPSISILFISLREAIVNSSIKMVKFSYELFSLDPSRAIRLFFLLTEFGFNSILLDISIATAACNLISSAYHLCPFPFIFHIYDFVCEVSFLQTANWWILLFFQSASFYLLLRKLRPFVFMLFIHGY